MNICLSHNAVKIGSNKRMYFIKKEVNEKKSNNAGSKAPDDIEKICCENGLIPIPIYVLSRRNVMEKMWSYVHYILQWLRIIWKVPCNARIVYQHPQYDCIRVKSSIMFFVKTVKKYKFICIIHDLDSLRGITENARSIYIADHKLLKHMDCLICHNEHMKNWLIEKGISEDKLICLEIFDYLIDENIVLNIKSLKLGKNPTITIAGNLAMGKAAYIYKIQENGANSTLKINLYGNGYDEVKATIGMIYKGAYKPDELLRHLEGSFGLVWDGVSAKTCAGSTGEYLRYNNPHKTSLYLAAGIPVIVWKEAAIADFVLKNGVGIAVESLENLDVILQGISEEEYKSMCDKVAMIGQKIRNGEYFSEALKKAVEFLK